MKKVVEGTTLLALLGSPAVAQTSSPPLPPGFADVPETKWGASVKGSARTRKTMSRPRGTSGDLARIDGNEHQHL